MIFYFIIVALSLVYMGGAFFDINFGISLFLAGMGAAMMALIFASQARLLNTLTRGNQ